MDSLQSIDLQFLGIAQEIGAYLVETDDGPGLFDCGPATTIEHLRAGVASEGLELADVRHLLLSHIHLDHAGAAGHLVRENPDLTVWVSEIGAPHLIDPTRLASSARRLWGPAFDSLWGELVPVPESNIRMAKGNVLGWDAFPTPGHASHHVSYERDGTILVGDAAGIRIVPDEHIVPVSPPPDIDVEAWHRTIDELDRRGPERLALIHFGVATDTAWHLERLRKDLDRWAARVRDGMDEETFVAQASAENGPGAERYENVITFAMSYQGLKRYWDRRDES